ncbi:hypothetical protein WME76_44870 (plasmid) [Sorangium sp. So ce119]|uniref:hypothetical protein n=1 Tax=Sorangium sp. So ce119 TaxID=3133279 RepID=UPI003F63EE57
MRSRKAAAAVVVEELPPSEDPVDAIPPDDIAADEAFSAAGGPLSLDRICIDCGSSSGGGGHDGCAHRERARFQAPSRAALELVARLRRAAAEHRAAARALRALVTAEHARGRAELERAEPDPVDPPQPEEAPEPHAPPPPAAASPQPDEPPPAVCPRCAERASERPGSDPAEAGAPPRRPKRRGRVIVEQQALPFASDAEQRPPHGA